MMKHLIIAFCIAVSIGVGNGGNPFWPSWQTQNHNNKGMGFPHYLFEKKQGTFMGIQGMKPEQTTPYIVAQLGPGLVTDMTIFACCGGKPIKFTQEEIVSGFNCKNETSYACYKVCQLNKLGFINADNTMDGEKLENHIFSMMTTGQNKTMDDLEECFQGKTLKNDGKRMGMKNAMQCVWDSYYKNCEPNSEFSKNKRLVGDGFWAEAEKEKEDKE